MLGCADASVPDADDGGAFGWFRLCGDTAERGVDCFG
jgi:hypothetical protein